MSKLMIMDGVTIDEIENVVIGIKNITGQEISDYEVIKSFVNNEEATMYYMDSKLQSRMIKDVDTEYLWLDSGFIDLYGNAIFISLHKSYDGFSGHYTNTSRNLFNKVKNVARPKVKSQIESNYSRFKNKYNEKIANREIKHIVDINEYYIAANNRMTAMTETSELARMLEKVLPEIKYENEVIEETNEVIEAVEDIEKRVDFTNSEKEITVELLMDQVEAMQAYIDGLHQVIEELKQEKAITAEKMQELQDKKKEYELALAHNRESINAVCVEIEPETIHDYLENGKILIAGAAGINEKTMRKIAKDLGFEKKDLEIETDYYKGVERAGRLSSLKYKGIILGACPHSSKATYGESSSVEGIRKNTDIPVIEARAKSGELKITNTSYREALLELTTEIREIYQKEHAYRNLICS